MTNFVSSIYNGNQVEVFEQSDIMRAHKEFYANLFSQGDIDLVIQEELSNGSLFLSESDKGLCDSELCLPEIMNAVKKISKNKSPGPDGLTAELYCYFWDSIEPVLVDVLNTLYEELNLCESMKTSNTRLVFKKGGKPFISHTHHNLSLAEDAVARVNWQMLALMPDAIIVKNLAIASRSVKCRDETHPMCYCPYFAHSANVEPATSGNVSYATAAKT